MMLHNFLRVYRTELQWLSIVLKRKSIFNQMTILCRLFFVLKRSTTLIIENLFRVKVRSIFVAFWQAYKNPDRWDRDFNKAMKLSGCLFRLFKYRYFRRFTGEFFDLYDTGVR